MHGEGQEKVKCVSPLAQLKGSLDGTPISLQHSFDLLMRRIAGDHDRAGSLAFAVAIPDGEEIRAG